MSKRTITEYTCNLCDAVESVPENGSPRSWLESVHVGPGCLHVDLCRACVKEIGKYLGYGTKQDICNGDWV